MTGRLIILCEGLGFDGAVANVAWQQALGLSRDQPVCLISDGLSPERRRQTARAPQLRLRLMRVPDFTALHRFGHLPHQLVWILMALRAMAPELSQGGTATVICHSHPLATAIALRFGRRVRLVMISHGDAFLRPPGTYDPAILWLYRRCTRPAHRLAAVSVALSPAMAQRIEVHGVPPQRIALIPNGLDPAEIGLAGEPDAASHHWQLAPLRLLFVGRLDRVKGVDVLLDAIALVQQQGGALQLDLITTATSRQALEIRSAVASRGLSASVRLLGFRPRTSLASHYLRSHVVVVPSRDDPLPTVVLEAMACARPVVASDVGGIPYLLAGGDCGVLVPAEDPDALAHALLRLDRDRLAAAAMGQRGLERSRRFSWAANVRSLRHLLTQQPPPERLSGRDDPNVAT